MFNHNEHQPMAAEDIAQRSSQRKSFSSFPLNIKKLFAEEMKKTDFQSKTSSKNVPKFYVQNLTFQNPRFSQDRKEQLAILKESPIKHMNPSRISTENNWSNIKSLCQSLLKDKKSHKKISLCQIQLPTKEDEILKISQMKRVEKNGSSQKKIKSSTGMRVFNKKSLSSHKIYSYIKKRAVQKTLESENSNIKIELVSQEPPSKPVKKQRKSQPFPKKTLSRKIKTQKSDHNLDPCLQLLHLGSKLKFQQNGLKPSGYKSKRMNKSENSRRKRQYFKNEAICGWDISENQIFLLD